MRLPLVTTLRTRTGNYTKDARLINAYPESKGEGIFIRKRPGAASLGSVGAGVGQLLACYNGQLRSIIGNTLADLVITTEIPSGGTHTLPGGAGGGWLSTAYGAGNFVAINQSDSTTVRSVDGETWTVGGSAITSGLWAGLAFGAGLFVAIDAGAGGTNYATSPTGAVWTPRTFATPLDVSAFALAFTNNTFIATALSTNFKTSVDGLTWANRTITGYPDGVPLIRSVVFGNGVYVFRSISSVSSDDYVSVTSDFLTWNHFAVGVNSGLVFDGVQFVLLDQATSPDGSVWTPQSSSGPDGYLGAECYSFGGGIYVAAGSNAYDEYLVVTSTDGFNWTTLANYGTSVELSAPGAMAYGGGVFTAVSSSSDIAVTHLVSSGAGGEVAEVQSSVAITSIDPSTVFFAEVSGQAQSQNIILLKNSKEAWTYNMALIKITDADYPGWSVVTPTSITRSGSVVTVTLPAPVNWQSGSSVTIAGAAQTEYNGAHVINVTDATHFTFPVTGTPATPATGTITATGGRTTVPGIVYLDGYFFVMDQNAVIYNCNLGDATSWNALDFVTANIEPGSGIAIAKSQNYVIAMKSWSTEFFYDAGNAVGSPLSPVLSAFTLIGCASGESVANIDGSVMWVSKTRQKGRAVHIMAGLQQQKISTPDIERILNADSMENIYSYGVKISGHIFYVLGLRSSNITLVYDNVSGMWTQWSSLTAQTPKSCTIVSANGVATVTLAAHDYNDGDPVLIAGAAQAAYNGQVQIRKTGDNTFTYPVEGSPASPATGAITATGYDETYFKYTKYAYCSGRDLVLHETSGELCEITESVYQDSGQPINLISRTGKIDGGTIDLKTNSEIKLIGNKTDGHAMLRWSDDDYSSNSAFRTIDLSSEQSRIGRCGSFRRRSFELRHVGNSPVQLAALELQIGKGK